MDMYRLLQEEFAKLAQQLKFSRYEPDRDWLFEAKYRLSKIETQWSHLTDAIKEQFPLPRRPLVLPIPVINLTALEKEVKLLNKRARKLGCPEITLVKGPEGLESYVEPLTDEEVAINNEVTCNGSAPLIKARTVRARAQLVELVGQAPHLDGWELIGTLELLPTGENMFRAVPGKSIPESYRQADKHCDHCKTNRQRKDVVLVRDTKTGEHKQVGRSCVRDFFHGHSPDALLFYAEMYFKLERFAGCGPVSAAERYEISLESFLAHVALCVTECGYYVTKAEAQNDERKQPTVSAALHNMGRNSANATEQDKRSYRAPATSDWDLARNAIQWIRDLQDVEGDFMQNLKVLFTMDFINQRNTGSAGWAVKGYIKEVEKRSVELARLKASATAAHVGEIGKREVFELRYTGQVRFESFYGQAIVLKFLDQSGNVVTWMTSADKEFPEFELGAKYSIKATVKKHSEYKGVKQTELSRAKIGDKIAGPELRQEAS